MGSERERFFGSDEESVGVDGSNTEECSGGGGGGGRIPSISVVVRTIPFSSNNDGFTDFGLGHPLWLLALLVVDTKNDGFVDNDASLDCTSDTDG